MRAVARRGIPAIRDRSRLKETAAGALGQDVAKRLCLFDGREAVQADFVAEDDALDTPRHLASALGVPLPEAVDRVRFSHGSHDTGLVGAFRLLRARSVTGVVLRQRRSG